MTIKSTESFLEIGAAYIRVSTDDQTELSPDAQVRVIQEEAKKDGFYYPLSIFLSSTKAYPEEKPVTVRNFKK